MIKRSLRKVAVRGVKGYHKGRRILGLNGEDLATANQLSWPEVGEDDEAMVLDLLRRRELSLPMEDGVIDDLAAGLREYFGVPYALPQNNGTSSLHAAFFGLGIGPGDEVVVPSLTFHSSATAIAVAGAEPVFCDVDAETLTLCPEDLRRAITPQTKAVCVVHLHAIPAAMDEIQAICDEHGIAIVEDAAQAHGAEIGGRRVGSIGAAAALSFQKQKGFSAGEGGALLTRDPDVYDRALVLGHFALAASKGVTGRYDHLRVTGIGFKYRIHPLGAGLALTGLRRFEPKLAAVRDYCRQLEEALAGVDGVRVISPPAGGERGAFRAGFPISIPRLAETDDFRRQRFFLNLRGGGIHAEPVVPLLHLDPRFGAGFEFRQFAGRSGSGAQSGAQSDPEPRSLPVCERLHSTLVVLEQYAAHVDGAVERTRGLIGREIGKL